MMGVTNAQQGKDQTASRFEQIYYDFFKGTSEDYAELYSKISTEAIGTILVICADETDNGGVLFGIKADTTSQYDVLYLSGSVSNGTCMIHGPQVMAGPTAWNVYNNDIVVSLTLDSVLRIYAVRL